MTEQVNEIENLDQTATKAADDTTMEGDFTPAEQEGMAEYKKLMDAIEKGEEYAPDPAADVEQGAEGEAQADAGQKTDDASAQGKEEAEESAPPSEEELSAILTSHAEAVTGIEAELKAAEEKAIALGDQLENGEINQAKYDIEYRRAMRDIEAIEGKLATAQAALSQSEIAVEQASVQSDPWYQAATNFLAESGNDIFNAGEHHEGLKQAIAFASGLKQNADKAPAEIIRIAADTYRAMTGLEKHKPASKPYPAAKNTPKPAPDIPPTLGQMQAALPNNDDSPFAHLMNLSGPAYEEAYSKLSQAQKDAFMDSLAG